MVTTCKVQVPQWVYDELEPIKHDDDAVKEYGIKLCVDLCQKLFDNGILGAHIYTLNLEKSAWRILEGLNILKPLRDMPWRPSAIRKEEEIRPVHWN
mmetsp:Transcript_8666/g.1200  ORF Transcript_8666/g.1200 Transcript_8666/m.1200 type:complete len:97 (+) Transcript_8666:220-510(+)